MKQLFISLIRQYLFWMVFFFILRAIFLLYHVKLIMLDHIPLGETLLVFWYSLKLDTATTGYILALPALILLVQGLLRAGWLNAVNKVYTVLIILCWSVITAAELGSFSEWKFKLTTAAFIHLRNPKEVYYSISALNFFSLLIFIILITFGSYFIYTRFFYVQLKEKARRFIYPVIFFIITIPILFLMLRGGFNAIAISESAAFYSNHSILNWTSVNSGYHLATNIMETKRYKKSTAYEFYNINEAKKIVDELLTVKTDTSVRILKMQRPNIVVILLESWTADIIGSLGAEPEIAPEFEKLVKEGILFSRFYSAGNRSHEGTASLLGGLPALPYTTYTANPVKFPNLPAMVPILNKEGYYSSFYYGGQLDYGNMRAYLRFNQFDRLVEEKDLDNEIPRGRLGVHDEFLFKKHIEDLGEMQEPFFSIIFTLSSHSPYDFPMEPVIDWAGRMNNFLNSVHYTDKCLGEYFDMARKQSWFDNTLFIVMADHGHNSHKNWRYESYEYHRIPLLFYGNVINDEFRGLLSDRIADNSCVARTLLNQLGLPSGDFKWGYDLFNPYATEFAYMVLNDGYAWKSPQGEIVYSFLWKHYYTKEFPQGASDKEADSFIRQGKAYVQVLFRDFLDR